MGLLDSVTGFLTGGAQNSATQAQQQALQNLQNVETPDIDSMKIQLDQLVQQGVLTPEQAQTYLQGPSAMNGITLDPALQQASKNALLSLQNLASQGGMTAADRANLNSIQNQELATAKGARDAILQNAQARGLGSSGMAVLAELQNAQDAATRQNQRDLDVAGQAQSRALQALQNAGTLGGQMQDRSFQQQSDIAKANDAINNFNAQNKQNVENQNVQARNAAQQYNLQNKQDIANQNVGLKNQQEQFNKGLTQQDFENRYRKAGGVASGYQNLGQQYSTNAQQNLGVLGSGLGALGAALSDKSLKEDIVEFDPSSFLDQLVPSKYRYKNPERDGKGLQVGVMAQDLEKGAPQMVIDTPQGKMVDYSKAGGPIFASLASLHKRLKELEEGEKA